MENAYAGGGDFNVPQKIGYYDNFGIWHDHSKEDFCIYHPQDISCIQQQTQTTQNFLDVFQKKINPIPQKKESIVVKTPDVNVTIPEKNVTQEIVTGVAIALVGALILALINRKK